MATQFGPQLIGETEKTLNALLFRFLEGTGLGEPQWVTLRLAGQLDVDASGLAAAVADRAHFADTTELVNGLTARGLLENGRLSSSGREMTASVQDKVATATASIFGGLSAADVDATTRVLNEIVSRARQVLDSADEPR